MTQQPIYIPPKIIYTREDGLKDVFILGEKLGQGGFAVVHQVTHQGTNKSYAMKVIPKERYSNIKSKSILEKLENEIQIQKKLSHINIVSSKISFSDETNQYMILEYCPGKSIREYLKKSEKGHLSEPETRKILNDILQGLAYLHNRKIIHHDLKLENFLIGADGRAKIADFGVSAVLKNFNEKNFSICGTANYMSPEILQKENKGHGIEVDIWAIGVSAFIMLTGQQPFLGFEKDLIYEKIKNCDYHFPATIQLSMEAKDFIKKIFRIDPRRRPSALELLDHPFLTKYDKERIQLYKPPIPNKPIQNNFSPLFNNNNLSSNIRKVYGLNNRCSYNFLVGSNNNMPIVKPVVSDELSRSLKRFNYLNNYQPIGKENVQSNEINVDIKKNYVIPNHFVSKYCFYYDDLGFLLGDGTVGVCFNDKSRIVMDPNEEFIQYYKNYNSKEEVIKLDNTLNEHQKNKLQSKISLVQKFARNFKKFTCLYKLEDIDYDSRVPLYHVKYFVKKNDSILFKLNDKNVQVNYLDHRKLIIFSNTKKMCLVTILKEKCNLMDLKDVLSMNQNCEEYKKYKIAKDLLSYLSQKIIEV